MSRQRGDDLDDDFVPDDLVALSDAAGSDLGDDVQDFQSADEDAEEDGGFDKAKSDREKKRKRREKEKERKAKVHSSTFELVLTFLDVYEYSQKRKLAETSDIVEPESITAQSPVPLQEYLASKQAKTFSTMSVLELDDMRIPGMLA